MRKLILLFSLLLVCSAAQAQSNFLIPVTSSTGLAIGGATVTLTCLSGGCGVNVYTGTSDTTGNVQFTNVVAGRYTVTTSGPRIVTYSYTLDVACAASTCNPSSVNSFIYENSQTQAGLQASINTAGLTNAKTLFVSPGTYSINTATPLTVPAGVNIIGSGVGTSFSITGTGDLFDFQNGNGSVSNANVTIATTANRSAGCLFNALTAGASGITLSNLTFNGNAGSPNNGKTFCMNVSGAGIWNIFNPLWVAGGGTWQSAFEAIGSASTVTSIFIYNPVFGRTLTCNDACLIFDTLVDTAFVIGGQIAPLAGNAINVRNSGASTQPSWVHFIDTRTECGGAASAFADFKVDAGRDIEYTGYQASCQNGTVINGGTRVSVHHTSFTAIGQDCFVLAAAPLQTDADHNHFEDCGINTNNTYSYVKILNGANGCTFDNNDFRQLNANKAAFVFTATGAISNCNFDGNDASQPTMGSGYNNTMGGTNVNFMVNKPAANFPNSTAAGMNAAGNLAGVYDLANQGSVCTNGELALSGGWQSTGSATVTAAAGNGQTCSWTITTGTTTAANPTVTDTLTNALPAATTVCWMSVNGGTHTPVVGAGTSDAFRQTTLSATAPVFTYQETPTAGGTTYFVTRGCGP